MEIDMSSVSSAKSAAAITKNDTTLIGLTRGLFVGGAGAVTVRMANGANVTFAAVPAGCVLPICCDRVLSTGTDATSIVALY